MTWSRPVRSVVAPVIFLHLTYVSAQSAEPATTPSVVSPLEQAKRDLETAKGSRIKERDGGWRDLREAVPPVPLQSAPVAPAPAPRSEMRPSAEKNGRNWLVEAMDRKSGPSNLKGEGRTERAGRDAWREGTFSESTRREDQSATEETAHTRRDEERDAGGKRDAERNPFARFLKDWVSPQDFALLQSTLAAPRESNAPQPTDYVSAQATDVSSATAVARSGDTSLAELFVGRATGAEAANGRGRNSENPFLQFLPGDGSPARSGAAPAPPSPVARLVTPVPSANVPAVVPNPKGAVPDFVRPIAEDKLYRQLKRF